MVEQRTTLLTFQMMQNLKLKSTELFQPFFGVFKLNDIKVASPCEY